MELVEPSTKKFKLKLETLNEGLDDLPLCEYGLSCEETELIHFAEYLHPISNASDEDDASKEIQSQHILDNVPEEVQSEQVLDKVPEEIQSQQELNNVEEISQSDIAKVPEEMHHDSNSPEKNVLFKDTTFREIGITHELASVENTEVELIKTPITGFVYKIVKNRIIDDKIGSEDCVKQSPNGIITEKENIVSLENITAFAEKVKDEEAEFVGKVIDKEAKQSTIGIDEQAVFAAKVKDTKVSVLKEDNTDEYALENKDNEAKTSESEISIDNLTNDEEDEAYADTQEEMSEYDEVDFVENNESQLTLSDTVLNRGPSIVKSYSLLTDDQRKELIRKAFELKSSLQNEVMVKTVELALLQSKLDNNRLYLDGEEEALGGNSMKLFSLFAERSYQEGSAAQIHFRLAESQFYRLLSSEMSSFKVIKVEYVVNPFLVTRFKQARKRLEDYRCRDESLPVLGFHGTSVNNIFSICSVGFRVPGEDGFRHASDPGWYGAGVYFSEYPSYSMPYIRDASKILLCQVLPGKVFKCKHVIHGEPLRQGYDSHISPNGKELVVFNSHHILPSYIVHYKKIDGDYHYEVNE